MTSNQSSSRMVLVVTPWFPSPAATGAGIFNLRDAELLASFNRVKVLHLVQPGTLQAGNLLEEKLSSNLDIKRINYHPSAPGTWWKALAEIRRELRQAQILHTMAFPALLPLLLVPVSIPWVHAEHWSVLASPSLAPVKKTILSAVKLLFRRPNRVVAVSQALRKSIQPYCREKVTVIDNEVVLPDGNLCAKDWRPGEPLQLIAVGSLIERKGPILALEALKILRESGLNAQLVWVGGGELLVKARSTAERLGLTANVRFLGQVSPGEITHHLLQSHIFVLPTETETFGVSIAEALGCGLPVVVTGTGGHLEFVNATNGVVADRTPSGVASAIQKIVNSQDEYQPEVIAREARSRFSPASRVDAYKCVYRRLDS